MAADAGLVMDVLAPNVDEREFDPIARVGGAKVLAGSLALAKAESVRVRLNEFGGADELEGAGTGGQAHAGAVIVAADQVGERRVDDGATTLLSKPASAEEARSMLLAHSNATVVLTNGLVAMDARSGRWAGCFDIHHIEMGEISPDQAAEYVEQCAPLDCVGAYRIEDGQQFPQWNFVTGMRGDSGLDGIMGLPIETLRSLLAQLSM